MIEKMESLHKNQTWELEKFFKKRKPLDISGSTRRRRQHQIKKEKGTSED